MVEFTVTDDDTYQIRGHDTSWQDRSVDAISNDWYFLESVVFTDDKGKRNTSVYFGQMRLDDYSLEELSSIAFSYYGSTKKNALDELALTYGSQAHFGQEGYPYEILAECVWESDLSGYQNCLTDEYGGVIAEGVSGVCFWFATPETFYLLNLEENAALSNKDSDTWSRYFKFATTHTVLMFGNDAYKHYPSERDFVLGSDYKPIADIRPGEQLSYSSIETCIQEAILYTQGHKTEHMSIDGKSQSLDCGKF